ncbi:surface antigen-domain-containing protein [Sporodiniella umbellata]|nr:surface antigen-domain-containing protein [Sporodiniella umbellata]
MEGSNPQLDYQKYLFSLLVQSAKSRAHVNAITILGAKATRPSYLEYATRQPLSAKTVADVINFSQETAERLAGLDIFDEVQVLLENASDHDILAEPDSINVVYQVKEKSRLFIKTGTEIGNNEGNMNGSITVRNLFGGAEVLETVAAFGTRTSSAFQFSLAKPVNASPDSRIDVNAHRVLYNNGLTSSYEELARGLGLRYKTLSRFGYHELSYDLSWRTIDRVLPGASLSIRKEAGHSLKSSINHVFVRERRDDSLLPSNGHYVRIANEYAGALGIGNTQFIKSEIEAQVCHQLGGGQRLMNKEGEIEGVHPGWVISASARAGYLSGPTATISDRFFLGGPLSVRGFKMGGIGPRDYNDALGGQMYWAGGLSFLAPLPKLESKPLRAHLFVNAGANRDQGAFDSLFKHASTSVGFGLLFRHSIARLELNYCIPLTASRGDHIRRGLQFGIGLNFL